MASRYLRDTTVLAKLETTSGTDAAPTGAANAIAISNVNITSLNASFVGRDLIRSYFGISEQLIAQYNKLVSYEVEFVGSGTAGTAPAWSPLARSSGMAETIVASERVVYKPVTNGQESSTQYVYDSGILHKFLYCKGNVSASLGLGGIPKLKFAFVAVDGGDTASAPSGVTYAAWQQPQVAQQAFTGPLTLGGALSATGVPAITGGVTYPSTGYEVDLGMKAEFISLIGQETVEITDRQAKGKIKLDATVAQEIAFLAAIKAGTLQTIGLVHGNVVGRRAAIWTPNGQLISPSKEEMQGKRLLGYDVVCNPSVTGNDEVHLITSF